MTDTCYILASGASLNHLTVRERAYLNEHPRTLAFNKFLMFWDLVNIVPTDYFIADRHFPSQIVAVRSLQIARALPQSIRIFLDNYYQRYFGDGWGRTINGLRQRILFWAKHRYWIPLNMVCSDVNYCHNILENDQPMVWAKSLSEPLYFHRGSLTTVLNLATIIYPDSTHIKLLGVDLNSNDYFFDAQLARNPKIIDRFYAIGEKEQIHPLALQVDNASPITAVLPAIFSHLNGLGIHVSCCNPESLLVTDNLCSYSSVI